MLMEILWSSHQVDPALPPLSSGSQENHGHTAWEHKAKQPYNRMYVDVAFSLMDLCSLQYGLKGAIGMNIRQQPLFLKVFEN